jgi:hypothetical protein
MVKQISNVAACFDTQALSSGKLAGYLAAVHYNI